MCQFKSGIILKNRVFVPDYDSHTQMLKELGIEDNVVNAMKMFVRAELIPANNDPFSDIGTWIFKVDQDILPDWFDPEEAKQRMIEAVKKWAKTHIYFGVDNLKISSGSGYFLKNCKNVEVYGNATVNEVCGNATVKWVYGNATVNKVYGNATVNKVCENATVNEVYGNATVKWVCENATVNKVCENATVNKVCENATVNEVCGNATVKWVYGNATVKWVCENATVNKVCENATVNKVCENATVKWVYGNATVKWVCENATVNKVCGNATVKWVYGNATVITSSINIWQNRDKLTILSKAILIDRYSKKIYQTGEFTVCIKDDANTEK